MAMEIMSNGTPNFGPVQVASSSHCVPSNVATKEELPCLVDSLNEIMRVQDDTMAMLSKLESAVYGTGLPMEKVGDAGYRNAVEHASYLANNQKAIASRVRDLCISLLGSV